MSAIDLQNLKSDDMLSEGVICNAMNLLKAQFPQIMGLAPPISCEQVLVRSPKNGDEHNTYKPCTKEEPYLQILNTGSEHWITAYKAKGIEESN